MLQYAKGSTILFSKRILKQALKASKKKKNWNGTLPKQLVGDSEGGCGLARPRRSVEEHVGALRNQQKNTCYCYLPLRFKILIWEREWNARKMKWGGWHSYIWSFKGVGEDSNDLVLVSHILHLLRSTDPQIQKNKTKKPSYQIITQDNEDRI